MKFLQIILILAFLSISLQGVIKTYTDQTSDVTKILQFRENRLIFGSTNPEEVSKYDISEINEDEKQRVLKRRSKSKSKDTEKTLVVADMNEITYFEIPYPSKKKEGKPFLLMVAYDLNANPDISVYFTTDGTNSVKLATLKVTKVELEQNSELTVKLRKRDVKVSYKLILKSNNDKGNDYRTVTINGDSAVFENYDCPSDIDYFNPHLKNCEGRTFSVELKYLFKVVITNVKENNYIVKLAFRNYIRNPNYKKPINVEEEEEVREFEEIFTDKDKVLVGSKEKKVKSKIQKPKLDEDKYMGYYLILEVHGIGRKQTDFISILANNIEIIDFLKEKKFHPEVQHNPMNSTGKKVK
jgi:hypothetical protein